MQTSSVSELIPGVDYLPLPVSVQDDVAVSTVELTIVLRINRNSTTALHPPDL